MRIPVCIFMLLLAGCQSVPAGKPNAWMPWNWGKGDPSARIDKFEGQLDAAKLGLLESSREFYAAANAELDVAADAGAGMTRMKLYLKRGMEAMEQAIGPMAPERARAVEAMVHHRASEDPAQIARGDRELAVMEKKVDRHVANIDAVAAKLDDARVAETKALDRARIAESKWDAMWFWIWLAIGGYVAVQILPLVLRAFPALGPVTEACAWLAAPAVKASYNQLRKGVVGAVDAAERGGQIGIDALKSVIDAPIDEHEQKRLRQDRFKNL